MKQVFVCQTIKHVYTALFAAQYFEKDFISKEQNMLVICSDHQAINSTSININLIEKLGFKVIFLNEKKLIDEFTSNSILSSNNFLSKNVTINYNGISFASNWLNLKLKGLFDKSDSVYLFHDKTFLSKFFLNKYEAFLIEDGLANYTKNKVNGSLFKKLIRLFWGLNPNYYVLGESRKVKAVFLFHKRKIPNRISHKVKFLNQKKFYTFHKFHKADVLSCFTQKPLDCKFEYSFILLTQGLDVAKLCTESEKLDIYFSLAEIISSAGFKLLVKLHPSESSNVYDNFSVLNNTDLMADKIPIEALAHLVSPTTKIVSLRSSAEISELLNVTNLICFDEDWKEFDVEKIKRKSQEQLRRLF